MKSIKFFPAFLVMMFFTLGANAQLKTETFKVSGNCGMCKSKIEKAAKEAGAKSASWNEETKDLTVSFKASSTNAAKIQEKIAGVGYDNAGATATKESYDKLHGCCKYDRVDTEKKDACCSGEKTCEHDKDSKHHDGDAGCCKDGKCSKEGHTGKDCCKK